MHYQNPHTLKKHMNRQNRRAVVLGHMVKPERKAAKAALHQGNIDYCGVFG